MGEALSRLDGVLVIRVHGVRGRFDGAFGGCWRWKGEMGKMLMLVSKQWR